jgi:Zn-finger nucleic acid-binding protein
MMFIGEQFCPHCGAKADRVELPDAKPELCPRCRVVMNAVVIGGSPLRECPHCEGIWADTAALEKICEDREKQSAVLGMALPLAKPAEAPQDVEPIESIHYIPCPVCGELMNRVNFAQCSHVIVDVCTKHGTWFDRDELRRIVEFIQSGGMMQARAQEIADEERRQRALQALENPPGSACLDFGSSYSPGRNYDIWGTAIGAAGVVLRLMMSR